MLIVRNLLVEINTRDKYPHMTFTANGECLWSAGGDEIRMWRVEDRKQMATMKVRAVWCLAVSPDGKWIAAGTKFGEALVWDAKTGKQVFSQKEPYSDPINDVDFSPDSTRFVLAESLKGASVWDIGTGKQVLTLNHHLVSVNAAKYSPQGDRIATTTLDFVRVWDSNDGRMLVDIKPWQRIYSLGDSTDYLWFNNHLTLAYRDKIKRIDASTGSTISEWTIPRHTKPSWCIALPQHGEFIAYSTDRTITFWDTSTHTELGLIQHSQDIFSIAVSPDGQFLAISDLRGKICIKNLSSLTASSVSLDSDVCLNRLVSI